MQSFNYTDYVYYVKSFFFFMKIILNEVGPRDWRFSHGASPPTQDVYHTIRMLESAGIERVEVGASVNYEKYPYMRDTFDLLSMLRKNTSNKHARYSVYVGPYSQNYPKDKIRKLLDGGQLAKDPGMPDELSFSISASEKRNIGLYKLSGNQVFDNIRKHIERARQDGVKYFRGYVSAAFGYENSVDSPLGSVIGWSQMLLDLGCHEVALGDSRGHAVPGEFIRKWSAIRAHLPLEKIALHFHENNYITWEADIVTVLADGVRVFDTSIMDVTRPVSGGERHTIPCEGDVPPNASTEYANFFITKQVASPDYPFRERIGCKEISTELDHDRVCEAGKFIRNSIAKLAV